MTAMGNRKSRRAVLASLAGSLVATAGRPRDVRAAPPVAAVVSTRELAIRACPTARCEVVQRAPLGSSVEIVEGADTAFPKVSYRGVTGFANSLYLATDPTHVPYLVAGESGCERIALIFNIGVGFEPAAGILDTLATERVPATMFVMGWWASEHPPILERMVEEGYVIGSHGNWPQPLTGLTDSEVRDDLSAAAEAIEHATGEPPAPFFTPYAAAIDERVRAIVAASGSLPVAWEVPAADYGADATADSVYDRVMEAIYDGAIVELHLDAPASAESTGAALPLMIRDLRAQGYRFVTIPELAEQCP
jgi:peptidoglycan/xylan/chitin deacetylase (PgdA/CDA1 family)